MLFGEIPDSAFSLFSVDFYDVDLLAFGFGIIDCIKVEGKHDIEFQFRCGVDIHETI